MDNPQSSPSTRTIPILASKKASARRNQIMTDGNRSSTKSDAPPSAYEFTVFKSRDGKVVSERTKKPALTGSQVLVSITNSGVCGMDQSYWNAGCALGHEGIGVVKAKGPGVRELDIGDRVGWGYIHGTCHNCRQCLDGHDQYCSSRKIYGVDNLDQGSMAYAAIWPESALYHIPEQLPSLDAAPLMCAGASIFAIYEQSNVKPNDRVGIIGLGGLGHMAVIFGAKLGVETVVFTHSATKHVDAIVMGATETHPIEDLPYILEIEPRRQSQRPSQSPSLPRIKSESASPAPSPRSKPRPTPTPEPDPGPGAKSKSQDKIVIKPLDHLIVTTTALVDWSLFFRLMAPRGSVHLLAVARGEDLVIPSKPLIGSGLRVFGSLAAPRAVMLRMLEFAARHRVKPIVQKFPLTAEGIGTAMKKLDEGSVRYRAVLETPKDRLYEVS